jgi:hypothetical protein
VDKKDITLSIGRHSRNLGNIEDFWAAVYLIVVPPIPQVAHCAILINKKLDVDLPARQSEASRKNEQRFARNRRKRLEQEGSEAPHTEKLAMLQPSIIKKGESRDARENTCEASTPLRP